ncbi:MAG: glycine cleavage T C-terminal barrel domain-containing protein, partial [Pseudomonadales bacterium]
SAVYSPRLEKNIALAMVDVHRAAHLADIGMEFVVIKPDGKAEATVVEKPFFDPKKKLAAT